MADRKLTPEEVKALGLEAPARKLAPEEVASLGLEAPESAAPPDKGALSAAGRGFVQGGTMGFGDEAGGAIQGGLQALANVGARLNAAGHPGLADALGKVGIEAHYEPESVASTYRAARDDMRAQDAAAAHAHPLAFGGGALAGAVATAKPTIAGVRSVAPALAGKGLLPALGLGATLGAAAGLGTSTAEAPKEMALDTLGVSGAQRAIQDFSAGNPGAGALDLLGSGALGGVLAAGGGYGLGKAISPVMDDLAIRAGRRAHTNGARQLSTRLPLSDDAVRASLESKALRAGDTTEQLHGRLEHLLGHDVQYPEPPTPGTPMALYGQIIDALEANGAKGADVRDLASQLEQRAGALQGTTGASKTLPDLYRAEAQNVRDIAPARPRRAGVDSGVNPKEPNLGLRQAEALKRDLQTQAKFDRATDSRVNTHRKQIAGIVRAANEQAVADSAAAQPENARLQALNAQFIPAKRLIGALSEAEQAAKEGAARGSHRSLANLPEQIEIVRSATEGRPDNVIKVLAQSLLRPRVSSTLAVGSHALSKPSLVAQLAALLQRAGEAGSPPGGGFTAQPVGRDEKGRPILVIHTGP